MQWLDRILNRSQKAVYGGPLVAMYANGIPISSLGSDPKARMAKFLECYKVGWFYKAERKIASDLAGLGVSLSYEDAEGDNEDEIVAPRLSVPFASLSPEEQFLRLMERPNPTQTGRQLRAKTQIRIDFAGAAIWFLDGGDGGGLPDAIWGINPARMEPSVSPRGELLGWVMDKGVNGQKGVPFTADEILVFSTGSATDEWYGTSVVEAVWSQVPLTDLIARHTADVLTTGGRLAGMVWPKDRALDQTEFEDAQRAWRNVSSDPNAARRLLLFPEPMEYAAGASTPKDIGIPELAKLNREEITTAFPVNPYMLGLPLEPGMNSGESLQYVQRDYWRNTIHDRAEMFEETVQVGLVTRYEEAIGRPLDFDLEEPDLDDGPVIVEKAGAMRALIALGFEPEAARTKVGLDDVRWLGLPQAATEQPTADEGGAGPRVTVNDSNLQDRTAISQVLSKSVKSRREEVVGESLPGFQVAVERFLKDQRQRTAVAVEHAYAGLTKAERKAVAPTWWDSGLEDDLLRETIHSLYVTLSRSALTVVANEVGHVVFGDRIRRVTETMLRNAAERITGINETTREAVAKELAIGVQRGYTVGQLVNGVPDEKFAGVRGLGVFEPYRAELIARTETMRAYNESSLRGYQEYGIEQVQASDGDYDDECRDRDGQTFSVDDALTIEDHPNGTLDWVPVVPDLRKSWDAPASPVVQNFYIGPDSIKALDLDRPPVDLGPMVDEVKALREDIASLPAPVVEVAAPVVNVPAPVVSVKTPTVTDVRIVGSTLPPKTRRVKRDPRGFITEVSEE